MMLLFYTVIATQIDLTVKTGLKPAASRPLSAFKDITRGLQQFT